MIQSMFYYKSKINFRLKKQTVFLQVSSQVNVKHFISFTFTWVLTFKKLFYFKLWYRKEM